MRHGTHLALLLRSHISKSQWRPLVRVMFVTTNPLGDPGPRTQAAGLHPMALQRAAQGTPSSRHQANIFHLSSKDTLSACLVFAPDLQTMCCVGGKVTYHGGHNLVHQSSRIEADSSLWQAAEAKGASHLSSSTCRNTEYLCYQDYPPSPRSSLASQTSTPFFLLSTKTAIPARGGRFFSSLGLRSKRGVFMEMALLMIVARAAEPPRGSAADLVRKCDEARSINVCCLALLALGKWGRRQKLVVGRRGNEGAPGFVMTKPGAPEGPWSFAFCLARHWLAVLPPFSLAGILGMPPPMNSEQNFMENAYFP